LFLIPPTPVFKWFAFRTSWLPIHHRIKFKLATLTLEALSSQQPPQLSSLLHPYLLGNAHYYYYYYYYYYLFVDSYTAFKSNLKLTYSLVQVFLAHQNSIRVLLIQHSWFCVWNYTLHYITQLQINTSEIFVIQAFKLNISTHPFERRSPKKYCLWPYTQICRGVEVILKQPET